MKIRKKHLLAGVLALLLILMVSAIVAFFRQHQTNAVEQKKETVNQALQQEDSCKQQNIDDLKDLYSKTTVQKDKAQFAWQAAHCQLMNKQYDDAIEWFKKAEVEYTSLGDTENADLAKASIDNTTYMRDYKPTTDGNDPEVNRGDN